MKFLGKQTLPPAPPGWRPKQAAIVKGDFVGRIAYLYGTAKKRTLFGTKTLYLVKVEQSEPSDVFYLAKQDELARFDGIDAVA